MCDEFRVFHTCKQSPPTVDVFMTLHQNNFIFHFCPLCIPSVFSAGIKSALYNKNAKQKQKIKKLASPGKQADIKGVMKSNNSSSSSSSRTRSSSAHKTTMKEQQRQTLTLAEHSQHKRKKRKSFKLNQSHPNVITRPIEKSAKNNKLCTHFFTLPVEQNVITSNVSCE
uniref:Uncharacterized protein n=1 Tax=Glossina austeni TaxID=7395 RepID=A0A1A9UJI4_GLOAU